MPKNTLLLLVAAGAALFLLSRRANAAPAENTTMGTHDDWSPMLAPAMGVPFWQSAPFSGR